MRQQQNGRGTTNRGRRHLHILCSMQPRGSSTVKPTHDPVTGYPAVEIGSNLVILKKETTPSDLSELTKENIHTVLTPSDRDRLA